MAATNSALQHLRQMDNWKAVILLLAAGQGILLSLALFSSYRNRDKSGIFLGLIIWVISLEILTAWGMETGYFAAKNNIPYYLLGSYLILPPATWLFARLNTEPDFHIQKKHFLLFLPAILETVTEVGFHIYFFVTGEYFRLLDFTLWHFLTEICPILWMIAVLFLYGRKNFGFYRQMKEQTIKTPPLHFIRLFGLYTFLVLLSVFWATGEFLQLNIYFILNMILVSFLFILGYTGYRNPSFFNVPEMVIRSAAAETISFPQFNDQKEFSRLMAFLAQNPVYTRPKLSLEELAGEVKLPPRYVSHLINRYHCANFSHFVNTFRVKEVIRKLEDPAEQHKTLLALALESGFNSKSAFNQVFKSHTGQAPSQFLQLAKS